MSKPETISTTPARLPGQLTAYYPVIADIVAVVLYWVAGDLVFGRFSQTDIDRRLLANAFIAVAAYLVFLWGFNQLIRMAASRRLQRDWYDTRQVRVGFALAATLVMTLVFSELSGFIRSIFTIRLQDIDNSLYFLFGPSLFVFFALVYLLIVVTPVQAHKVRKQDELPSIGLAGVLAGVPLMVLLGNFWRVVAEQISADFVGIFIATLALFALPILYLIPRATFRTLASRGTAASNIGLISLIVVTLFFYVSGLVF